jgi:hypothetical protein
VTCAFDTGVCTAAVVGTNLTGMSAAVLYAADGVTPAGTVGAIAVADAENATVALSELTDNTAYQIEVTTPAGTSELFAFEVGDATDPTVTSVTGSALTGGTGDLVLVGTAFYAMSEVGIYTDSVTPGTFDQVVSTLDSSAISNLTETGATVAVSGLAADDYKLTVKTGSGTSLLSDTFTVAAS